MNEGTELGRYTIIRKIGSGGMGEVYLAHDKDLDRDVALKVLPEEFSGDSERMKRFKQEARAASALNHPNIITIYEIGESDGRAFIVTEFVDGETLREKIIRRELTLIESVKIAEQIASALSVAHAAHIVHRDIKPENIMIRRDGYVKILDFGLAKSVVREAGAEDRTLQLVQTQAGLVMGSVRYMSPEQARGKSVDERTDIWSVGVVLYEMVTGKNPFDGETVSDSLAALIHVEPVPVDGLVENTPEGLNWIIRKSLKKNADERYQNIKDLKVDLKELAYNLEHEIGLTGGKKIHATNGGSRRFDSDENATLIGQNVNSGALTKAYSTGDLPIEKTAFLRKRRWILPVLIITLLSLSGFGLWFYNPFAKKSSQKFDSLEISKLSDSSNIFSPAISTDGKYIAYINIENGKRSINIRQVATGSSVKIVETPASGNLQFPVFSSDGNYIYYSLNDSGISTLYQIPTLGGAPKKIIVDIDTRVAPSPDGKKLAFARNNAETNVMSLLTANIDGSGEEVLTTSEQVKVRLFSEVSWTPDNENLLVFADINEVYSDDLVKDKIFLFSIKNKTVNNFGDKDFFDITSPNWTNDGANLLLVAKGSQQEPSQIWELNYPDGKNARRVTNDSSGYVRISLARESGAIVATKQDNISSLWAQDIATGATTQLIAENRLFIGAATLVSTPDNRILIDKSEDSKANFYTINSDGKDEKPLTADDAVNFQAAFSPDKQFIVFSSSRSRVNGIWRMNADGGGELQLSKSENAFDDQPLVLPDNKTVVFVRRLSELSRSFLMKVPLDGSSEPAQLFPDSTEWGAAPHLSPDGKSFLYSTIEPNADNTVFKRFVRIRSVENGQIGKIIRQLDGYSAYNYIFTPDGKNLSYIDNKGVRNIYNQPLAGGAPKQITNFTSGDIINFNWSNDGKKLYLVRLIVNNELVLLKDSAAKNG